jgi:hypothetical protein
MEDRAYERLLVFLALEGEEPALPPGSDDEVDAMVAEAASMLADLRGAAGDIAGSLVWQQVAEQAASAQSERAAAPHTGADPWLSLGNEPEEHDEPKPGSWSIDLGYPSHRRNG